LLKLNLEKKEMNFIRIIFGIFLLSVFSSNAFALGNCPGLDIDNGIYYTGGEMRDGGVLYFQKATLCTDVGYMVDYYHNFFWVRA
jgi:hypothetical protein